MNPVTAVAVVVGLVALTAALGMVWQRQQGRIRHTDGTTVIRIKDIPGMRRLGSGATLLQFSTDVCAPCRATHTVLDGIATELDAVTHVDLDVTNSPELAARFHIMQTPTTLVLDRAGVVRARIGGAPRREELREELDRILMGTPA